MDHRGYHARIARGMDGIEEEVRELAGRLPGGEGPALLEMLDYILNQRACEREYPNGTSDVGRGGVRFGHFLTHKQARDARPAAQLR